MDSLSSTVAGMPTAASLSAPGAASTTPQPGPTVQGPGGQAITLPDAAPADFQSVNPTPLDQPHPTFPALIQSHVAVLLATGTSEAVIAQLNSQQPQAEYMERKIQGEIMQDPEGWDDYLGNPHGTARAGLQQLMPGVQLPAVGAGTPGYLGDGSNVSGINVPGLTTPLLGPAGQPAASEGEGLIKGLVLGTATIGVGLLAWRFVKNRSAAGDVAKAIVDPGAQLVGGGVAGIGVAGAGGGAGAVGPLQEFGKQLLSTSGNADDITRTTLGAFAGKGTSAAATTESILKGLGPANGFVNSAGLSAMAFDMPMAQAINAGLADRYMGVLEMATKSGQLADFAATQVAMRQALAGGADVAGGAAGNVALRNLLAGVANVLPV